MSFVFEDRPVESPFIESLWRTQSEAAGEFISTAEIHSGMVFTRYEGRTTITLRGPETIATPADFPAGAEFFGIIFKLGTYMPALPASLLMNRNDVDLPKATGNAFWLHGSTWEVPTFLNADTFVNRLARMGMLVSEPVVDVVMQGRTPDFSPRMVQYRFVHSTGLTQNTIKQIERAKHATALLEQGTSILDTTHEAGYFDQAHLTRSLKRFMGRTPAQIHIPR